MMTVATAVKGVDIDLVAEGTGGSVAEGSARCRFARGPKVPLLVRSGSERACSPGSPALSLSRRSGSQDHGSGLCAPLRSATRKRFGCKCVRFGIPFSRNPRNPDVGKLLEQGARFRVQGSDVLLANLRAAVYLVDHELRVKEHPDALDFVTAGELESFDERPIFRNGVDGGSDRFGDLSN